MIPSKLKIIGAIFLTTVLAGRGAMMMQLVASEQNSTLPGSTEPERQGPTSNQNPAQPTLPVTSTNAQLALPTAEQLHRQLQLTRRQLDSCRIVVANRGDQNRLNPDETIHPDVWFSDTWLSGDNAQQHRMAGTGQTPWWTGFRPLDKPFTTTTVNQLEGRVYCVRDSGKVQSADLSPAIGFDRSLYPILYSASQKAQRPLIPFVPLAVHNRKWNPYSEYGGAASAVDDIAQVPLSQWKVLRFDQLGDKKVVLVEVMKEPKGRAVPAKRHSGTLTIMPIWLAWFSLEPTYFPLKVESAAWYEWQGKRYDFERTEYSAMVRFTAGDLTDYGSGFFGFPGPDRRKPFTRRIRYHLLMLIHWSITS